MRKFEYYANAAAKILLRAGIPLILLALLHTCFYILFAAPDGGVMLTFRMQISEMLANCLATLGLLIAAAAIPDIRLC